MSHTRPSLTVQFVQIQVELQATGPLLRDRIEQQLQTHGQPLRWAITRVTHTQAHVEAVVTRGESRLNPGDTPANDYLG